jgi:hypothetical protein
VIDDSAGPETPPSVVPEARKAQSNRRVVVLVAIVAGALVTGLLAFVATRYSAVNSELSDIRAIRRVTGEFGAASLTYDYRDLGPFEKRMKAHATGTFRRQLGEGLGGLETLIKQLKSRSEATVKQVFVSDVEESSASALVVVEARAQNGHEPPRTLDAAYIELQLVKVGSRWLIDGVSTLDLGQAISGAGTGTTTSTTGVPSK